MIKNQKKSEIFPEIENDNNSNGEEISKNYYSIKLSGISAYNAERDANGTEIIYCDATDYPPYSKEYPACPKCGSHNTAIHGSFIRTVHDLEDWGERVILKISGRRFVCQNCGQTFTPSLSSIEDRGKITKRLQKRIYDYCLEDLSFIQIAKFYGISDDTVKDVFTKCADEVLAKRDIPTPAIIGIDEVHLNHKMRLVVTDVVSVRVIDMYTEIKEDVVISVLKELERYGHIEIVTMDMSHTYRPAVKEALPNAKIIVDYYHLVDKCLSALEFARIKCRKKIVSELKTAAEKKDFKDSNTHFKKLMLTNLEVLVAKNQDQMLFTLFGKKDYKEFAKLYFVKESFRSIFIESKTREEAKKRLDEWKKSIKTEEQDPEGYYAAFRSFLKTVNNWEEEILNNFDEPNRDFSNGPTESLNARIKAIQRIGRGYSFPVLRRRVLLGIDNKKIDEYIKNHEEYNKQMDIDKDFKPVRKSHRTRGKK